MDLRIAVGAIPVPGFSLSNIRGASDLGPHKYNVGVLEIGSSDTGRIIERENNGLVYTCRGGFLDIAHIRDWADMTVYLTAQIARNMDRGAAIDLSDQGGKRTILLGAIDKARISSVGRRANAVALAKWLAFQLSIWHEISTWYGYASATTWPEKISAFSPEDIYSDLLGVKLAGGIIAQRDTGDERRYNEAMDAWIAMTLKRLRVVSKESATGAIRSVAGIWWDPSRRIPDWKLTTRRQLDIGPVIHPWLVSMAFAPSRPLQDCAGAGPALALRSPESFQGTAFTNDAVLQIEVSDKLVSNGFPLPRKDSRRVTQADFPAIIEVIRGENAAEFGVRADRPEL
ncbi:MAG: DUF4056 domain-containing protein [Deltaproteobacteria bacterium]|nr:DUF4056 domain-containing protein [Deltaproteobacteria bacterium]